MGACILCSILNVCVRDCSVCVCMPHSMQCCLYMACTAAIHLLMSKARILCACIAAFAAAILLLCVIESFFRCRAFQCDRQHMQLALSSHWCLG